MHKHLFSCLLLMASTSSTPTDPCSLVSEDTAAKTVSKRYEGLVTIRTKAISGKGAWYWTHFEPILISHTDTNLPKAVKLRCSFCNTLFSASNPSRTASEHLKRGTCPNFNSVLRQNSVVISSPLPISSLPSPTSHNHQHNRKRNSLNSLDSLAVVDRSTQFCNELGCTNSELIQPQNNHNLKLSCGKDDLGALAMFENSIKKLKSPKPSSSPAGSSLSKNQINSALESLADWFYETCGSVSFSSLEHPKFRSFLHQVGLPPCSIHDLSSSRLENRFLETKAEVEARIRDAMFFQIACNGWKMKNCCNGEENLVKFSINLPNGTSLYQKIVLTGGSVSSKHAEEIIWEAVMISLCGSNVLQRCVGIVADKYNTKALRNLEIQHQWMVNLPCQVQGLHSLINDFCKELQVFRTVTESCFKLANFVNNQSQIRISFQKYRLQELDYSGLLRVPSSKCECTKNFLPVYLMFEDILSCARVLHMVFSDDSYKSRTVEDFLAAEVSEMIQGQGFWNSLEAVYSLMKIIKQIADEIEADRLLIGQCLTLWEDLKAKVKSWSVQFNIIDGNLEKILDKRFKKNYHPAWSAGFILDPLYLMRDINGKYVPPFKCLTHEQEKDVDKVITRLVSKEEAHVVLMELMKWRTEGLDPLYAQAVQLKQKDPITGKMKNVNPQGSRLVWETCLSEYKTLGKVAVRLIFLQASSCGFKCNWNSMKWQRNSRVGLERAQKMMFIAAHSKLERRDLSNYDEEKDGEMFRISGSEDDMFNGDFVDTPSV
ncbi:uncharacterized protein LOC126671205 [Mercurialis annua]|uniref:uncharacterized protein LOC126671205 n=1 Tax=Mercurialis annua TaxID=3986 RepID=UPI00215F4B63|nr:uncharacterized protein LOC126671205 [Mercurialis annua]